MVQALKMPLGAQPTPAKNTKNTPFIESLGLKTFAAILMAPQFIPIAPKWQDGIGVFPTIATLISGLIFFAIAVLPAIAKIRARFDPSLGFVGWTILSTLCSIIVLTASIKQLTFVLPSRTSSVIFLGDDTRSQLHDIHCDSNAMLVRFKPGDSIATYRCPHNKGTASYLLTHYTLIAPWPDYTEGTSKDLASIMNEWLLNTPRH